MIRRRPWSVGLLAALALGVRLAYVLGTAPRRLPFSDAEIYQLEANLLAKGHGFIQPFPYIIQHKSLATAAHPPLYTIFLAAGSLFGATSVQCHQIMGCCLGVGTVVGCGLIASHVVDDRTGLVAMAVGALYPPLWVTDGGIMSEGLFAFVTVLVILSSYLVAERRSIRVALLLGVSIGLAMLTRAEAFLLFVILVIPLLWRLRGPRLRQRLSLFLAVVVGSVVVVSPWVVRNLLTFHQTVTLSTGNDIFLGANCPDTYYGSGIGNWFFTCAPSPPVQPGWDESDISGAAEHAGLKYAKEHLSRVPLVVLARVGRIWQVYQPVTDATIDQDDGRPHWASLASLAGYAAAAPFAIGGLVVLIRTKRRSLPLVAQLVAVTVTAAITWGAVRFRVPADVVLVVLAAVLVDAGWEWRRPGARRGQNSDVTALV